MNEFHKINCPHCGQSIEYPAEGRGQNVPCPTCEKRIDLPHASSAYEAELSAEQKSKLRYFGLVFDESCSAASVKTAIVEYQKLHPEKKDAYYNRPATQEQIAELRKINREEKLRSAEILELGLTYREARDLLYKFGAIQIENKEKRLHGPPSKVQRAWLKKTGIKLASSVKFTAGDINYIMQLEGSPPHEDDLSLFKQHGITQFNGDALGAYALGDLIRSFGGSAQEHNRRNLNYLATCQAATSDLAYLAPTLTVDDSELYECLAFAWPKSKIKEWLRMGAE
jgi:hypothetical protein